MDPYQETFNTWNKLATKYEDRFMDLDLYNDTYDFICNSIDKPKAKLLEIGCGPGNISRYLLSKRPDFDIFGIDIAPNMIELARQNNPTARFAVMDSRHIHMLDTKFDGIVGGFCLPFLSPSECNELISSSYDLLNDDGLLYLSFIVGYPGKSGFKTSDAGQVYLYYHEAKDLKADLSSFNFGDIKTYVVKYNISETEYEQHMILIAKKQDKNFPAQYIS